MLASVHPLATFDFGQGEAVERVSVHARSMAHKAISGASDFAGAFRGPCAALTCSKNKGPRDPKPDQPCAPHLFSQMDRKRAAFHNAKEKAVVIRP